MKVKLEFKWHDKWFGVFDKKKLIISFGPMTFGYHGVYHDIIRTWEQHVWICVIPCVPFHIWWEIDSKEGRRGVIA